MDLLETVIAILADTCRHSPQINTQQSVFLNCYSPATTSYVTHKSL
jgi:hypothetical protein